MVTMDTPVALLVENVLAEKPLRPAGGGGIL